MIDGLKPCPFCGNDDISFIGNTTTLVCRRCGCMLVSLNPLMSNMEAAEKWNRRIEK